MDLSVAERIHLLIKTLEGDKRGAQKAFCDKINCHQAKVSNWLSGRFKPNGKYLFQMEDVYNINPRWVLEGEGTMLLPVSSKQEKVSLKEKLKQLFDENKFFDDLPDSLHHRAVSLFLIDKESNFLKKVSDSYLLHRPRFDGELGIVIPDNKMLPEYAKGDIVTINPISLSAVNKKMVYVSFLESGVFIGYVIKLGNNKYSLRMNLKDSKNEIIVEDKELVVYNIASTFKNSESGGVLFSQMLVLAFLGLSILPVIENKSFSDDTFANIIPWMFGCGFALWLVRFFRHCHGGFLFSRIKGQLYYTKKVVTRKLTVNRLLRYGLIYSGIVALEGLKYV